jgi:hypothetical protein
MARFRHTVDLTPVPRPWFDKAVAAAWDAVAEHLGGPRLPLVDGDPLTPGAHYERDATVVTLDAWDRDAETAGRVTVTDEYATSTCHVRLHSATAPRALALEGGAGTGRRATTVTGALTADLERWWACRDPAVRGRFAHAAVRGSFTAGLERGDPWRVRVTVTVHARGRYLPVAGPALLLGRTWLRREFARALAGFAARWDAEVPAYLAASPDEVRALVAAELARD